MKTLRIALAAALALASAPASAAQTQATFQVSATVVNTCRFQNVANLAFGNYDPYQTTETRATSTFEFRCNKNTAYHIGIDAGLNNGLAAGYAGDRAMTDGTGSYLAYKLFSDAAYSVAWGNDSVGWTNTVNGSGTNSGWVTRTIYGEIPAEQDVAVGAYTDATVTITVYY